MTTNTKRDLTLRVADVMSREAVSVSANATMSEAANVLCSQDVSGVPVVDEMGYCVGIISTKDFAERDRNKGPVSHGAEGENDDPFAPPSSRPPMQVERFRKNSVREHMQTAVQTVSAGTSVVDAAKIMSSEHIHRLMVLDETARPVGGVSSLDLLKVLVNEISQ